MPCAKWPSATECTRRWPGLGDGHDEAQVEEELERCRGAVRLGPVAGHHRQIADDAAAVTWAGGCLRAHPRESTEYHLRVIHLTGAEDVTRALDGHVYGRFSTGMAANVGGLATHDAVLWWGDTHFGRLAHAFRPRRVDHGARGEAGRDLIGAGEADQRAPRAVGNTPPTRGTFVGPPAFRHTSRGRRRWSRCTTWRRSTACSTRASRTAQCVPAIRLSFRGTGSGPATGWWRAEPTAAPARPAALPKPPRA